MAWESSRPVPWKRLLKEWVVYAGIMAAIFVLFFRDNGLVGAMVGLLISFPLYLALGYVLAKVGYQRKNLRELRAERAAATNAAPASPPRSQSTPRPAPTRRTSSGPSTRPTSASKRRR